MTERCPTCKSVLLWSGLRLVCGRVGCPGDSQTTLDVQPPTPPTKGTHAR